MVYNLLWILSNGKANQASNPIKPIELLIQFDFSLIYSILQIVNTLFLCYFNIFAFGFDLLSLLHHCRLVVVLQEKTYIYDSNSLAILDTLDTVPNTKGVVRIC